MVEAVVFFTAQRLGHLLIQEAVSLHGVHEQVDGLQRELRRMQCFLQDAEAKQVTDESVRNWVAEVRDVAYDTEDVIDAFILKVAITRKGIRKVLKGYACIFFDKKWVHLHKVGTDIQSILARIETISASRLTYGIANVGEGSSLLKEKERLQKQLRESYPHVDDEDVIGIEDHIQILISELLKEEEQLRVISIVGVGGLGKTTLAKKVYKHDVKRYFDCFGWTSISQQCNRSDALCEILKKASTLTDQEMEATRKMNEMDLVEKLFTFLKGKRYLVVLDDIWRKEDWDILRPAFPNEKIGSKILFTTRNKEVASHADPHSLHLEPRCLTEDESWTLLCKKAFPKNVADINGSVAADFEKLGKEMLKKCGGLPLGVVVLGGLLATKGASIYEWEVVRRSINSYMNKGQNGVSAILALSYIDLPFHLKPCFLYLAFFPEDSEISRRKLIHLWVSEGFIKQQQKGQEATMEDVGEEQLADLAQRCMVQIGKRCRVSGRIKTCRLHDLMRDLCLLKAREEGFLEIFVDHHESVMTTGSSSYNRLRRYAIRTSGTKRGYVSLPNLTTSHLRTLMIVNSNTYVDFDTSFLKVCYQNLKLLRVLDLQHTRITGDDTEHTTKRIGELIHLVYLGMAVKGCDGKISPSICKLRSLQTLHLLWFSGCLPNTMWKMGQLRHLYLKRSTNTCNWRMSTWTNIHTLYWIHAGEWIEGGDLEKMTSLRKLGICSLTTSQARIVLASSIIVNRSSFDSPTSSIIGSLSLDMSSGNPFPKVLANALSGCHHIVKLFLRGRIETLPRFSPNLAKLTLILSELRRDPMKTFDSLPNLKYLYLGDSSYKGPEMVCSSKGFPQLQYLTLECLPKFRVWKVEQGAMPHLQCLKIKLCEKLEMVPEGLRFMSTLREFVVEFMSREFNRRIVLGGEDWYKIQHIPSIKTSNRFETPAVALYYGRDTDAHSAEPDYMRATDVCFAPQAAWEQHSASPRL